MSKIILDKCPMCKNYISSFSDISIIYWSFICNKCMLMAKLDPNKKLLFLFREDYYAYRDICYDEKEIIQLAKLKSFI